MRAVEELKALVRQNNLLLQALTRRQQPVHELELSETFQFPMDTEEDLQRVENTLQDKTQEKALVWSSFLNIDVFKFFARIKTIILEVKINKVTILWFLVLYSTFQNTQGH